MPSAEESVIISGEGIPPMAPFLRNMSLGAYLCHHLKLNGKEVAFIDGASDKSYTYEDLYLKSLELAGALEHRGYRRGDVVSISSENRLEYPVLIVAASLLGITVSTINPQYSEGELRHSFNLTRPLAVFCSPLTSRSILSVASTFSCVREVIIYDHTEPILENRRIYAYQSILEGGVATKFDIPSGDYSGDVAVVLSSSGTTGLPKGVMLTHSNLMTLLEIIRYKLSAKFLPSMEQVIMALVPFFHGYGLLLMLNSMISKGQLVILPHFDGHLFLSCIEKYKITVLPAVPPILIFLAKSPLVAKYDLSSLMAIRCGAAPVGKSTLEQVGEKLGLPLDAMKQGYGMTELTILATFSDLDVPSNAVGRVMPTMKMKVLDTETGKTLGVNQVGELCFHGPLVMKGYIGNPVETRNTIDPEGWLHTGDIGYYDEQHIVYIVDRLKELIKVKGFQVAPAELEALLLNHSDIADAAVIGKEDDINGEVPLAFVVKKPNAKVTELDIKSYVAKLVSPQKRLKGGVIFVNEIPKNPSGKILRRVLRERIRNKSKL